MKKPIISLCCFFAFLLFAQAQNQGRFGLRLGASSGQYAMQTNGISFNLPSKIQAFGRVYYQTTVSPRSSIQVEAGAGKRSLRMWLPDEVGFGPAPQIGLTTLEGAALFRYELTPAGGTDLYLIGGPNLTYAIDAYSRIGDNKFPLEFDQVALERLDFGLEAGAGINFGLRRQYGLELRYSRGFNSLIDQEDGLKVKHQAVSLALNYRF